MARYDPNNGDTLRAPVHFASRSFRARESVGGPPRSRFGLGISQRHPSLFLQLEAFDHFGEGLRICFHRFGWAVHFYEDLPHRFLDDNCT
jgi:hypothetical protein